MKAGGGESCSCCAESNATIRRLTDELAQAREELAELRKLAEEVAYYWHGSSAQEIRGHGALALADALSVLASALAKSRVGKE